jgi:hypothetical protein
MITESDRLAEALQIAAKLWPEANGDKGVLLRRILEIGVDAVERELAERDESRLGALSAAAGSLTGVWPVAWREELRDEWPA